MELGPFNRDNGSRQFDYIVIERCCKIRLCSYYTVGSLSTERWDHGKENLRSRSWKASWTTRRTPQSRYSPTARFGRSEAANAADRDFKKPLTMREDLGGEYGR